MAARLHIRTPNQLEQAVADKLDNSAPFNDDQGTRIAREPTGAGAEGAQGIHGDSKHPGTQGQSSADSGSKGSPDTDRKGSEPLDSNSHEHVSGYGGKGGIPKQPNDGTRGRR